MLYFTPESSPNRPWSATSTELQKAWELLAPLLRRTRHKLLSRGAL
jgi:hypothetical protein